MNELATVAPPEPAAVIRIPPAGPYCDVVDCELPAKADMVWYDEPGSELHLQQVCARCTFLLKGHWPALWAPLDQAPPLEHIAHELRLYLARRAPRPGVYVRQTMPFNGNVHWSTTMNGGTTSAYFTW